MIAALRRHWRTYLLEAGGLAGFMVGAGLLTTAFMHPDSSLHALAASDATRRLGIGVGMAAVTIALVYATARSGAHMNPVVTLVFLIWRKIAAADAAWYVIFQFLGAIVAPHIVLLLIGDAFRHDDVRMATSMPGPAGVAAAFAAELLITFGLVLVMLVMVDNRRFRRLLPVATGLLIGAYIAFESQLSGMSMNPARTFGSALASGLWNAWWLYFVAPPLGAVAALAVHAALLRFGPPLGFEEGPTYPVAEKA